MDDMIKRYLNQDNFEMNEEDKMRLKSILSNKDILDQYSMYERLYQLISEVFEISLYQDLPEFSNPILFEIPFRQYRDHMFLPLYKTNTYIAIGISDIESMDYIYALKVWVNKKVKFYLINKNQLTSYLKHLDAYTFHQQMIQRYEKNLEKKPIKKNNHPLEDHSIIDYAKDIMKVSMLYEASDVHLIHDGEKGMIKCRIEGHLHPILEHSTAMHEALIRRFLVLSSLDALSYDAQDGMFEMSLNQNMYTFRVAVVKAYYNMHAVIRIVHSYKKFDTIDTMYMKEETLTILKHYLKKHTGFIIVSGATGSGKSTTLHAIMKTLNQKHTHSITIEEPIEHLHKGMTQLDMTKLSRLQFEDVLKHCLRLDPDHLLIGEIRDIKTAKLAIQSAITGHMVLSSMHASQSHDILQRFQDLDISKHAVMGLDMLNIHQTLIPIVCKQCQGVGCMLCMKRGFSHREAIYEIHKIDLINKKMICLTQDISSQLKHLFHNKRIDQNTLNMYFME